MAKKHHILIQQLINSISIENNDCGTCKLFAWSQCFEWQFSQIVPSFVHTEIVTWFTNLKSQEKCFIKKAVVSFLYHESYLNHCLSCKILYNNYIRLYCTSRDFLLSLKTLFKGKSVLRSICAEVQCNWLHEFKSKLSTHSHTHTNSVFGV